MLLCLLFLQKSYPQQLFVEKNNNTLKDMEKKNIFVISTPTPSAKNNSQNPGEDH